MTGFWCQPRRSTSSRPDGRQSRARAKREWRNASSRRIRWRATDYWSVRVSEAVADTYRDLAWSYQFPTRQLLPISGLVAFYNEKVDMVVDGIPLDRPRTHLVK